MGQAEQRQVRTGVAARVREQTASSERHAALLSQVTRKRRERDEHLRHAAAADGGIRAAAGMAILDADPPPDEAVAAAAGWPVGDVEQLRRDLNALPPEPARPSAPSAG
jgi:hypothetical protein